MQLRNSLITVFTTIMVALAAPAMAGSGKQSSELDYQAVEQKMKQTLAEIQEFGANQKEQAVQQARTAVKALDRDIDRLEAQLHDQRKELSAEARKEKKQALTALREQRAELKSAWRDMKQESGEAWNEAQQAFQDTYQKAQQQWHQLAS